MNFAVIAVNDFQMPVLAKGETETAVHTQINSNTKLPFLGDIYNLKGIVYFSLGDFMVLLGFNILLLSLILKIT